MNEKLKAYKNTKNIQNTDKNPHEIVKYLLENFIICIDNVFTDIETEMDKKNTLNKQLLIKNKSNNITKMLTIIVVKGRALYLHSVDGWWNLQVLNPLLF